MSDHPSHPRLAYLTGFYPKASQTFIEREIRALRQHGADVTTTSIRRPAPSEIIGEEEEQALAETFYVLDVAKNPLHLARAHFSQLRRHPRRWMSALSLALRTGRPGLKGLLWQLFYFLEAGVLADYLQRQEVTHLHNHFAGPSANVAMLTSALSGIPFSFTLHGPADLYETQSWHLGAKIARSTFVACISYFARSQAMLFSDPAHWHKLRIVHCGVHPHRYATDPAPERTTFNLLFVGRLSGVKGLRILFNAIEHLRQNHSGPDVTLTLIGDGEDRAWAEGEAARIGGTTLLGFRSQGEVAAALQDADALILASFAEGVPVVLMEAMASARPVIATQVGGVTELVDDGINGRIVPPGHLEGLVGAITDLANQDAATRRKMGQAGRAKIEADFDITKEGRWLLDLFEGQGEADIRPRQDGSTSP